MLLSNDNQLELYRSSLGASSIGSGTVSATVSAGTAGSTGANSGDGGIGI